MKKCHPVWVSTDGPEPHNLPPCSKEIIVITKDRRCLIGHCAFNTETGNKIFIDYHGFTHELADIDYWSYVPFRDELI